MRVLVVEDEAPARRRLVRLLSQIREVTDIVEAEDTVGALAALRESEVDVVLLDIELPGIDGVAFARDTPNLPPVVFVTAFDSYAVSAFEVRAIDYLTKPVRLERLAEALSRGRERKAQRTTRPAPEEFAKEEDAATRIVTVSKDAVRLFDAREITRFWSSEKYTLFRIDGEEHLTEDSLVDLEARLVPFGFVRVHRAELVQLRSVTALRRTEDGAIVVLSDGQSARVSRRAATSLRESLAQMNRQ